MAVRDQQDLTRFIIELQDESDRGLPLVGAALIDELLSGILTSFFVDRKESRELMNEATGPVSTFSARIKLCYALGLIDTYEFREITTLKKIRNEFAHARHGKNFSDPKINAYCRELKTTLPQEYRSADARFKFVNATVGIVVRLYYRPEALKRERRLEATSNEEQSASWRSFAEEKPTAHVIIGIGQDYRGRARIDVLDRASLKPIIKRRLSLGDVLKHYAGTKPAYTRRS